MSNLVQLDLFKSETVLPVQPFFVPTGKRDSLMVKVPCCGAVLDWDDVQWNHAVSASCKTCSHSKVRHV